MASAAFSFDLLGSLVKVSVAPSGATTATLDSTVGVSGVSWSVESTDDSGEAWVLSTTTGSTTTITAPNNPGRAALLKCTVNGGTQTGLNGTNEVGDLVKTAKMYTSPEVGTVAETTEGDATYGYSAPLNNAIRAVNGGGFRLKLRSLTCAQITANQNNYAPTGIIYSSRLRLSSDAARDITGLTAGETDDVIALQNVGSFGITLKHESASSSAANRFWLPSSADHSMPTGAGCLLCYDATLARWTVVSAFS
jgi:hypothetical protein